MIFRPNPTYSVRYNPEAEPGSRWELVSDRSGNVLYRDRTEGRVTTERDLIYRDQREGRRRYNPANNPYRFSEDDGI
jgi:hypothetical protein